MKNILALNTITNCETQNCPTEKVANKESPGTFRFFMSDQNLGNNIQQKTLPTLENLMMISTVKIDGFGKVFDIKTENAEISSDKDEMDSRCSDSNLENLVNGIVSIIEGFGLLDYDSEENISKVSDYILSIVNQDKVEPLNNNKLIEMFSDEIARMPKINQNEEITQEIKDLIGKLVDEYQCSFDKINNKGVNNNKISGEETIPIQENPKVEPDKIMFMIKTALQETNGIKTKKVDFNKQKVSKKSEALDDNSKSYIQLALKDTNETLKTKETVSKLNIEQTTSKDMAENVARIAEKMTSKIIEGKQEFNITLKPEFLGKLSIKLIIENDGIKAQIKAGDQYVKGLIADQLSTLNETLKEKGVNMSHIEVVYENPMSNNTDQQFQRQNQQMGNSKRNVRSLTASTQEIENLTFNSIADLQELSVRNSSVEFSA